MQTLSRDTKDSLNKLDEIFDKKRIEERQELSKLFAKEKPDVAQTLSALLGAAVNGSLGHSPVTGAALRMIIRRDEFERLTGKYQ